MHKLLFLLLPVLLFSWQEYKDIDGIKIYKKYDKKFDFVQFKAQTQLPYSSEVISNIIMNSQTYPSWLSDCIQADNIDKQVYLLMQPPWPLDQRQVWTAAKEINLGSSKLCSAAIQAIAKGTIPSKAPGITAKAECFF